MKLLQRLKSSYAEPSLLGEGLAPKICETSYIECCSRDWYVVVVLESVEVWKLGKDVGGGCR